MILFEVTVCDLRMSTSASAEPLFCKIEGWMFNFFVCEYSGNLHRSITFNNQLENTSYHSSGFFINKPVVVISRVFFVSVDGIRSQMLAFHTFIAQDRLDFSAGITHIPFIHNV